MRRRARLGLRRLTAEEVVELGQQAQAETTVLPREAAWDHVSRCLAEHGYDCVDFIRARLWLRRGRPRTYVWDAPGNPLPALVLIRES